MNTISSIGLYTIVQPCCRIFYNIKNVLEYFKYNSPSLLQSNKWDTYIKFIQAHVL